MRLSSRSILACTTLGLVALLSACSSGTTVQQNLDGTMHVTTSDGTATMGGSMPSDWPADVPAYPGATVQYSASVNPTTGKPGSALVLVTADAHAKVVDFYKGMLKDNGWMIAATAEGGTTTVFSATKDARVVSILVADADAQTMITIGLESK